MHEIGTVYLQPRLQDCRIDFKSVSLLVSASESALPRLTPPSLPHILQNVLSEGGRDLARA